MAGMITMDKQEIAAMEERTKTSTRQVGNTTFTVIAHYSGEQTYLDMVKDVLRREIENSK
jgi:creatinine amidohydrolase/Fe(II)-dependent formamide hydrolase-like protein